MKNLGAIVAVALIAVVAGFMCTIGIRGGNTFSSWAGTKWEEHKVKAAERKAEREAKRELEKAKAEAMKAELAAKKAQPAPAKA